MSVRRWVVGSGKTADLAEQDFDRDRQNAENEGFTPVSEVTHDQVEDTHYLDQQWEKIIED